MTEKEKIKFERWRLLIRLEKILDGPMMFLGFLWLVLLIIELTKGLSPSLDKISIGIWILFILDFIISLIVAPQKLLFLKKNVFTIISLIVPAFRVLKLVRILRVLRGIRLVKVLSSLNRSMKSLAAVMSRRGFGYIVILTILIIIGGAAGMYAFEKNDNSGFTSFGEALWWSSMMVITVGTEFWPKSPEGKILCFFLALYGFAVLGYITATLATFFLGLDSNAEHEEKKILSNQIEELKSLVSELKNKL